MTKKLRRLAMFTIVCVAVGAAALTSCTKDDEVINDDYHCQLKTKDVKNVNMVIEQYGRLVSKALLNPGFRGELKKAVMEKFDGDYDVLAINFEDNDDTIGTRDVYFWDPLTKEYSIKGFNWTLQCVN